MFKYAAEVDMDVVKENAASVPMGVDHAQGL